MSGTWNEQATWRDCYEHLKEALAAAQYERDKRRNIGSDGQPEWIAHEFHVMHDETNRLRARLGRGPVDAEPIRHAEQMACGHIDYTTKFALYCADVVMGGAA